MTRSSSFIHAKHTLEITGRVDLHGREPAVVTSQGIYDLAADECARFASQYLGHPATGSVDFGDLPVSADSWNAGTRTDECVVGLVGADGQWETTDGPLMAQG